MKQINFNDYAIKLSKGAHNAPEQGMCVMECVAYIAGEEHTDHPKCADQALTRLAISLNDSALIDKQRQRLLPLVLRLAGSKTKDQHLCSKRHVLVTREDILLRESYSGIIEESTPFTSLKLLSINPQVHADRVGRFNQAWENALLLLDVLLPPADIETARQEEAEVVETKLRELVEVTK